MAATSGDMVLFIDPVVNNINLEYRLSITLISSPNILHFMSATCCMRSHRVCHCIGTIDLQVCYGLSTIVALITGLLNFSNNRCFYYLFLSLLF